MNYFVSDKSLVNKFVKIGKGSKIWNFCNIYGDVNNHVRIGKNTQIGSYSEFKPGVTIGDFCRFQSYVFLPENTSVGNYVFVGPGTKILNDKYPSVLKSTVRRWEPLSATIEDKVSIGGGVIIGPGVIIGNRSVIGAGAVIIKDIKPYSVVIKNNEVIGDIRDKKFKNKYGELLG